MADGLARLAAGRGDADVLRYLVDAGNGLAAGLLAERAAGAHELASLQELPEESSEVAAEHLSRIIGEAE